MRLNRVIFKALSIVGLVAAALSGGGCDAVSLEEAQTVGVEFVTQLVRNALAAYLF